MTLPALALLIAAELHAAVKAPEQRAAVVAAALVAAGATEPETRALMVVAWRESSLRPEVERCDVRGAAGEVGLWQARAPRGGSLCAGGATVQARVALAHWRGCVDAGIPSGGPAEVPWTMACYMGRKVVDAEVKTRADLVDAMAERP